MKEGFEMKGGIMVPVEKKSEPRVAVQVAVVPEGENVHAAVLARANDGSLWTLALKPGSEGWLQLPDLPNG